MIIQKGDCGFHMSASCFWSHGPDGNFNKKFDFPDFYCIVNVIGAAL